ncbi:MAG: 2-C-methyl-D-erythritol 2,4-cyclodiphosphate synthase [Eubacteriales bacterium]|nr:2-C-methyl-D-erythritol 2,4-cyclodiphosphate synthase [Eubacteriales bacterium]
MVWAVVVAAGRGARAGFGGNKVFRKLAGTTVLTRTLRALEQSGAFDGAVLVLAEHEFELYEQTARSEGRCALVRALAKGGATRAESVWNGLKAVPAEAEIVAVHDGARPFVPPQVVRATVDSAREYGSGVIATPVVDTVKRIDENGMAADTPDRASLRAVQTPQTFRFGELMRAYETAFARGESATDDASLYERHIGPVRLVTAEGAQNNKKLTTKEDFWEAEKTMQKMRIGTGYDVHRLVEGRRLVLCGVKIPYEKGLLGHSDADVALHALMDALLGAAAMGDIGQLFPDSDPAYKGADSLKLLGAVRERLAEQGMRPGNVDVTIVAQRPKLLPYNAAMRENVARALGLALADVSVKATTTEKLGFEGEGLGISAQAVAVVYQEI